MKSEVVMLVELITKNDLQELRSQILNDLRTVIGEHPKEPEKKWLKGQEVRKLLGISANTLQRLRVSGKLRYSKVGCIFFYRSDDLEKMLRG